MTSKGDAAEAARAPLVVIPDGQSGRHARRWRLSRHHGDPPISPNLSPSVIAPLRTEWETNHTRWQRRDLSARRDVYIWADGVYLQARMEPQAKCMLVLIGATPEGKKEFLGLQVGVRESAQSRRERRWASGRRWRKCRR